MAAGDLRDKRGKLIGRIKETAGKLEIRNAQGKLMGRYNPKNWNCPGKVDS